MASGTRGAGARGTGSFRTSSASSASFTSSSSVRSSAASRRRRCRAWRSPCGSSTRATTTDRSPPSCSTPRSPSGTGSESCRSSSRRSFGPGHRRGKSEREKNARPATPPPPFRRRPYDGPILAARVGEAREWAQSLGGARFRPLLRLPAGGVRSRSPLPSSYTRGPAPLLRPRVRGAQTF